jgi:hypothetical protein
MPNPPLAQDSFEPLFDALRQLRASWPARGWSWDSRFICVASTFTMEFETQAQKSALDALPAQYTQATLASASSRLREVAQRTGGLRPGQFLMAHGPIGGLTAFGLWWPWGDGETISMRVGLVDVDPNREPYRRLRDVFSVTM